MARPSSPAAVRNLLDTLQDALDLLGEIPAATDLVAGGESPASLLDQCLELCADRPPGGPEPVRTLHHFACSGGSLVSKCVATMPNTQLLSEVDPLSPLQAFFKDRRHRFSPTDMINLAQQSSRGVDDRVVVELFQADVGILLADSGRRGQHLVLRDHAHGHYLAGAAIPRRPNLRELVAAKFEVRSLVTVRHPLDSYLSLLANGWADFSPRTLAEYSRRYLAFLDAYRDVPRVRYEDFLAAPEAEMTRVCRILELPYNPDFDDLFDAILVTGDSGRSGSVIEPRPRRAAGEDILAEAAGAPDYRRLVRLLAYED